MDERKAQDKYNTLFSEKNIEIKKYSGMYDRMKTKTALKNFQFGIEIESEFKKIIFDKRFSWKSRFMLFLKGVVQTGTGLIIGDNPFNISLRSYTDKFNENTNIVKKLVGFSLYYIFTIPQNLLGLGRYKEGKGTYFEIYLD